MLDADLRSRGLNPRYSRPLDAAVSSDGIGSFLQRGVAASPPVIYCAWKGTGLEVAAGTFNVDVISTLQKLQGQ